MNPKLNLESPDDWPSTVFRQLREFRNRLLGRHLFSLQKSGRYET
jgi:hypothetical protein